MKVFWTFDPFEQNKALRKIGKNLLLNLFNEDDITAIYAASPGELKLINAYNIPKVERLSEYPKKIMQSQLRKLSLKNVKTKVLKVNSISTTTSVKELAAYSFESNADVIVTSTHAKAGIARFVLGSFAETLIHFSRTDLLLFNQKSSLKRKPKKIVYASDFSRKGTDSIDKILKYAKKWNTTIEVVHVPMPEFFFKFEGQDQKSEEYRKRINLIANNIRKHAKRNNIECNINFEPNVRILESDSILNFSKKLNADLIVVTAKSGKLASLIGGSVTRKIVRSATLPVLVLKV